jgi:hypothetical protein
LTPEDGTDSLSRNVDKYHNSLRNNLEERSSHLLGAEARNNAYKKANKYEFYFKYTTSTLVSAA